MQRLYDKVQCTTCETVQIVGRNSNSCRVCWGDGTLQDIEHDIPINSNIMREYKKAFLARRKHMAMPIDKHLAIGDKQYLETLRELCDAVDVAEGRLLRAAITN